MAEEIELKLLIQAEAHELLPDLLTRLGGVFQTRQQLNNTYYDTLALDLHRHRAALRLRSTAKGWLQTLKTRGSEGALSQRGEWEMPVADARLEPDRLPAGVLQEAWIAQLQPVFHTDFQRMTWLLTEGNSRIELALDAGEIRLPDTAVSQPLHELELELKQGQAADLLRLACRVAEQISVQPGSISKAEQGFRLRSQTLVQPEIKPLDWPAADLLAAAMQQLNAWHRAYEQWRVHPQPGWVESGIAALMRLYFLFGQLGAEQPDSGLSLARQQTRQLLQAFLPLLTPSRQAELWHGLPEVPADIGNWCLPQAQAAEELWHSRWTGLASLRILQGLLQAAAREQ